MTVSLEPGAFLGRYEVEDALGRGGMGAVYKIRDPKSRMPYAAKVLHANLMRERDFVRRFRREAKVARRLTHMNVVHVFTLKHWRRTLFYIMEFVEGVALDEAAKGGKAFGVERAARIIRAAAAGLQYIHTRRYVHRDIKPGNILIRQDDHLKIADFGLAQKSGRIKRTRSGHVMGTAKYMAPELIDGSVVDPRTDIYALGCLAYEILAGRPPFYADHMDVLMDMHLYMKPKPLGELREGLDDKLIAFIAKMIEKRRSRRIPSARLVHAWFDFYLARGYFADMPRSLRRY
ncbi:MAG: serine/threonine protein kinase [Planctomycetota bacterium]|jgi:serine/threonine-protein kinase